MHQHPTDRTIHTPVVEHWVERETAQLTDEIVPECVDLALVVHQQAVRLSLVPLLQLLPLQGQRLLHPELVLLL